MTSIVSQRPRDCLSCKIISGGGLIGAGVYIAHHSKKSSNTSFKLVMNGIALGAAGLGIARLLSLPPFDHTMSTESVAER